jgi:hypothetical protein
MNYIENNKTILNILNLLLLFRNQMKIYHWQTKKYSRHKASDELVEELDSLTDKYIETYSGIYDNIRLMPEMHDIKLYNISDTNIVKFINKIKIEFMNESNKIKDTELLNIRDEILGIIDKTLYLFKLE